MIQKSIRNYSQIRGIIKVVLLYNKNEIFNTTLSMSTCSVYYVFGCFGAELRGYLMHICVRTYKNYIFPESTISSGCVQHMDIE